MELVSAADPARYQADGRLMVVKTLNVDEINFSVNGGTINAYCRVGGVDGTPQSATYVPATHRWLRIREAGGTLYWDTSPDGTTWALFHSLAAPFAVTALTVRLLAGDWDSPVTPETYTWDNLTTPPRNP